MIYVVSWEILEQMFEKWMKSWKSECMLFY